MLGESHWQLGNMWTGRQGFYVTGRLENQAERDYWPAEEWVCNSRIRILGYNKNMLFGWIQMEEAEEWEQGGGVAVIMTWWSYQKLKA